MKRKKVLVGMSGGVDSSVVAALLVEQGYEVSGVFVEAYNEPGCRTDEDKKDALQVALSLNIPFQVLDVRKEYRERVVQYFLDEYQAGRTPNPDIVCNRDVKFGLLYDYAMDSGYDYLATGHYARTTTISDSVFLQRPVDLGKDQTYFLWQVARERLSRVLFPLERVTKQTVRTTARMLALPNATKPDSMGVCMIGELNVRSFLRDKLGVSPGAVFWHDTRVGTHEALWFHTLGERGGWRIDPGSQHSSMPALYVTGKDILHNRLLVGERRECYTDVISITGSQFFVDPARLNDCIGRQELYARIRNLGELTLVPAIDSRQIILTQPVFAPAASQSVVLYDSHGVVLGGAIIANPANSVY
jgi:tRNA-uridine 2-sulfurtransferase